MSLMKSKILLVVCNFFLLACGCILVVGGLLVLLDVDRILLSKLLLYPEGFNEKNDAVSVKNTTKLELVNSEIFFSGKPPLYYAAIFCAALGIFLVCIGTLGCWSSCLKNHCALTSYFLLVTTVLVVECAVFLIAWLWPHCLGLAMDSKHLVVALQKFYGSPGEEQFTAAVDLAQYTFRCCGIKNDKEYSKSVWKVKGYRPGLAYPLTCCKLPGEDDESFLFPVSPFRWDRKSAKVQQQRQQYLDPEPVNVTLCQDMNADRPNGFRHSKGCGDDLEKWFQSQYVIFLGCGLILVLVEFSALLSTVLVCSQIFKKATKSSNNTVITPKEGTYDKRRVNSRLGVMENVYERGGSSLSTTRKNRNHSSQGNFQTGTYIPGMAIDDSGSLHGGSLKA